MNDMLFTLAQSNPGDAVMHALAQNMVPVVMFSALGIAGTAAIVFGAVASVANTKSREQTRREVAAYVAEGSIGAEEAERILKAAPKV